MNKKNIKFLDCTFRDGGYYTNWNFPLEILEKYLFSISEIGINISELGYRSNQNKGFKGAFAYTSEHFLENINIPENLELAVMLNDSEIVENNNIDYINKLFPKDSSESKLSIVRVASSFKNLTSLVDIAKCIKNKGYKFCFNIKNCGYLSNEEIQKLSYFLKDLKLDALYLADSKGNLTPNKTRELFKKLKENYSGDIGIHAHDNLGYALINSKEALESGATWIDSTITGIGRGAGNVKTELLALMHGNLNTQNSKFISLIKLIEDYFENLKSKHKWGTNVFYYLAAQKGIHPTYIQNMMKDKRYDNEEILTVIEYLSKQKVKSFSNKTLNYARNIYKNKIGGDWNPKQLLENKEVLFIGPGMQLNEHKEEIINYIRRKSPFVLAMNAHPYKSIPADFIDARIAINPTRLIADIEKYKKLPQYLITPKSNLNASVWEKLDSKKILDFGFGISTKSFEFQNYYALIPNYLVISYSLGVCASGLAKKIYLAGFDGYNAGDLRKQEFENIFKLFQENEKFIPFEFITPTTYNLKQSSIYSISI